MFISTLCESENVSLDISLLECYVSVKIELLQSLIYAQSQQRATDVIEVIPKGQII